MTNSVQLRVATPIDVTCVAAIAEAGYEKYVERMGRKPAPMVADFGSAIAKGRVWVADVSGVVCGYAVYYPVSQDQTVDPALVMHLENIAVDPRVEGQGIGRRLIDHVETEATALGIDRIELYTNAKMYENLAYYTRLGFDEIDRRVEDGFDRVYFRKNLPD